MRAAVMDKTGTVDVILLAIWDLRAGYDRLDGQVETWMDPYTGEVALERDPRQWPLAANIFENLGVPLHVGSFGRLPVQLLWAVVGLAPAFTGFTMWLLKRSARKHKDRAREVSRKHSVATFSMGRTTQKGRCLCA